MAKHKLIQQKLLPLFPQLLHLALTASSNPILVHVHFGCTRAVMTHNQIEHNMTVCTVSCCLGNKASWLTEISYSMQVGIETEACTLARLQKYVSSHDCRDMQPMRHYVSDRLAQWAAGAEHSQLQCVQSKVLTVLLLTAGRRHASIHEPGTHPFLATSLKVSVASSKADSILLMSSPSSLSLSIQLHDNSLPHCMSRDVMTQTTPKVWSSRVEELMATNTGS